MGGSLYFSMTGEKYSRDKRERKWKEDGGIRFISHSLQLPTTSKPTLIDVRRTSCLFLEKLVSHSVKGDGQPRPEEKDEVCRQLVPG